MEIRNILLRKHFSNFAVRAQRNRMTSRQLYWRLRHSLTFRRNIILEYSAQAFGNQIPQRGATPHGSNLGAFHEIIREIERRAHKYAYMLYNIKNSASKRPKSQFDTLTAVLGVARSSNSLVRLFDQVSRHFRWRIESAVSPRLNIRDSNAYRIAKAFDARLHVTLFGLNYKYNFARRHGKYLRSILKILSQS
jgi:hypothetical protein